MRVFWIIFSQELKISFRHLERVFANFLFFVIFLSIFFILSQNQQNQGSNAVTFIWIALLASLIFSSSDFLKKDFEDGNLEQILLAAENLELVIFARMMANWFISCVAILALIFLLKLDYQFLLIVLFASLIINFLCCLCGALSMLGNSAPTIAIIILPLIIPVLLLSEGEFFFSIKLLIALTILSATICIFSTAKIVKIALE